MATPGGATESSLSDPSAWLDDHGDYLYGYALLRLRDATVAEDLVQETLLAALRSSESYSGRASERTWLVGILKHKIADHFRKRFLETQFSADEGIELEPRYLFVSSGEWIDHWAAAVEPDKAGTGPMSWLATPEELLARSEFWAVFDNCLTPLPPRLASAFTLREMEGLGTEEICEVLGVTRQNLWVMLHRARAHLRNCLESNWFRAGEVSRA
jgi:RNA polymerase sigma-70 factor (ECF subfamily)